MRELLIGQKRIAGKIFSYSLLAEEMDGGCWTYGAKISDSCGESDRASDLTCSQEQCRSLIEQMMRGDVTAVTFRDVVEDWLLRE